MDNEFSVINLLPSAIPAPRISGTHPLLKPVRHLPSPVKSTHSPLTGSPIRHSDDPSSPMSDWSVTDVGRFIEKHFLEKSIARVNLYLFYDSNF
jgi:hypothetical protein